MLIPIGKQGFIVNDGVAEPYITVQDDRSNTGGYLILLTDAPDSLNGHDDWVLECDLEAYFQETQWEIEWPED